jgi:hypothetical protein
MSSICTAVDWTFGIIIMLFAFCDFCKQGSKNISPIAKYLRFLPTIIAVFMEMTIQLILIVALRL